MQAVVADRSDEEAEVELRRRPQLHPAALIQAAPQEPRTLRAPAPRRGRRRAGRSRSSAARARSRRARPGELERAGQRLAAVGEGGADELAHAPAAPPGPAGQPDQRRLDPRARGEDGRIDGPHQLHLAGELDQHARRAVVAAVPGSARSRSAISRWTITSQLCDRGQLGDRPQQQRSRDRVGQVGDQLRRSAAASAARSSRSASPQTRSTLPASAASGSSSGRSRSSSSTTCTQATSGASRSVRAPPPPPTSRTTSAGSQRRPRGRSRRAGWVGEEVLAQPPLPGARSRRLGHHPPQSRFATSRRPGGVRLHRPLELLVADAADLGDSRSAVSTTFAGWFGLPRTGWGARKGESVSTRMPVLGHGGRRLAQRSRPSGR